MSADSSKRVLVIGAGFGGLACATELGRAGISTTVVDAHNYHLFVPLLYQVATAALSPADIARPIRRILGRYKSVDVLLGRVVEADNARRTVSLMDGTKLAYDRLVVATGSAYSYFGHPEWAALAPGPRTLEQARQIRGRLLTAFELAERTEDPARRDMLMTTVIVGGGPTGVEMAGSVAELARYALARDFRHIDPKLARIILIEAGPRLLSSFPRRLSDYARVALERLGVTVLLNQPVREIDAGSVSVSTGAIPAGTMIWGAGIQASDAHHWLGVAADRSGRILVEPDLSVPGWPDIFVIGDTAGLKDTNGVVLPALAQVAKQQGEHLGRHIGPNLRAGAPIPAFYFRNLGNTAIVGRNAAVFDFGRFTLKGRLAWLLWAIVHIFLLIGFQNRLLVAVQWIWRYLSYERGARLIMQRDRYIDGANG
jgi:NADH:ubiquinone reductase (H+-translocating)